MTARTGAEAPTTPPPPATSPAPLAPVRDVVLLTATRTLRGFGAGLLSLALAIDLGRALYSSLEIGIFLGVAMGGAAAWAVLAPRQGGRLPPKGLFVLGAMALAAGGLLLWWDLANPGVLLLAFLLGGVVAGGSDISPLGALEQGALPRTVRDHRRTLLFSLYNLAGYLGTATGALAAGALLLMPATFPGLPPSPRDAALLAYGLIGVALVPAYLGLSRGPEGTDGAPTLRPVSRKHRRSVLELSGLFSVDAFGGGLIANALVAYFLVLRFGPGLPSSALIADIAVILFLANVAAAASLLMAAPLARRYGLVNTMVFTHIPSSVLLILFAFTPTLLLAGALWVTRATLSQMDVPTRQSYTQAIVPREEGAAAAGYTTAARSAQALGGPVSGALFSAGGPWLSAPFALAGSVKIVYDLALYGRFRGLRPPEESPPRTAVAR